MLCASKPRRMVNQVGGGEGSVWRDWAAGRAWVDVLAFLHWDSGSSSATKWHARQTPVCRTCHRPMPESWEP